MSEDPTNPEFDLKVPFVAAKDLPGIPSPPPPFSIPKNSPGMPSSSLPIAAVEMHEFYKFFIEKELKKEQIDRDKVVGSYRNSYITAGLDIIEAEQYLDMKEQEITVLERASRLRRRFWKYEKPEDAEVWASRWIAAPITHLFPSERREEWLGDLYEGNLELLKQEYPRWLINVINIGKTIVLIVSAIQISVSDLISSALKRQK